MLIYGHRGAKGEQPENSLIGFEHLRSLGINHVELDVRLADNDLVVLHDPTLNRTANIDKALSDCTLQQLSDAGIPTLRETLSQWPYLKSIQIEVKTNQPDGTLDTDTYPLLADKLEALIDEFHLHQIAIITSFDQQLLHIVRDRMPTIPMGLAVEKPKTLDEIEAIDDAIAELIPVASGDNPIETMLDDAFQTAKSLSCLYFIPNHRLVTPTLVDQAHRQGLSLSTWTVNDVPRAQALKAMGVDSIITDYPTLMQNSFLDEPDVKNHL